MLRHPLAVAYATSRWRQRESLRTLVRHWVVAHELYRETADIVRLHEVRFEDFLCAPDAELARLESFLGLEPAPTTLAVRPDANEQYLDRWRREGRTPWGRIRQSRIRRELGDRVEAFGYDLDS